MPSLKKMVRARMAKTGERYQAALRHARNQVQRSITGAASRAKGDYGGRVGYFPDPQELAGFRAAVMQPFDTHDEARRAPATW